VNSTANGKLVHVTGSMRPGTPARDPVFALSGPALLRLSRTVEMYQWEQKTSTHSQQSTGGSKTTETTYTYSRSWVSRPVDSSEFKARNGHENPPMTVRSATFNATGVKVGVYGVDATLLDKLTPSTTLEPQSTPPSGYQSIAEGFYRGRDPSAPAIGDLRVTFKSVPAQTVSVIGGLSNGTLTGYRDVDGYTIALIEPGMAPAATMFHDELRSESHVTWILRGAGFVVMVIGFVCMTSPLTMLFAVLPFLEGLVGAGAFLVSLTLAIPITLLTIAIAWIVHRPLIGGGFLAAAVAAVVLLRWLHSKRARTAPAQSAFAAAAPAPSAFAPSAVAPSAFAPSAFTSAPADPSAQAAPQPPSPWRQ
jgi:hypothetical protein